MKKSSVKWAMTVICVLAAGVCYSCGGMSGGGDASGSQMLMLDGEQASVDDVGTVSADAAERADAVLRQNSPEASGGAEDTAADGDGLAAGENELSGESAAEITCFVHVCGEVLNPGVYELKAGSRIFEAVELAGGFTDEAASSYLNLAQEIADGMKIVVPSEAELEAAAAGGAGTDSGSLSGLGDAGVPAGNAAVGSAGTYAGGYGVFMEADETSPSEAGSRSKVNINTADMASLMTLKGIGAAKAVDIISYRDSNGPFRSIEDIMKVPGIKNAAFEKIKDDITV